MARQKKCWLSQTDADSVAQLIPARKEEAKNNAINAQNEAKAAFDAAKALLDKAPKGKGTKADIGGHEI